MNTRWRKVVTGSQWTRRITTWCLPVPTSLIRAIYTQAMSETVLKHRPGVNLFRDTDIALSHTFGSCIAVLNNANKTPEHTRKHALPFPKVADLSRQLTTETKRRPERNGDRPRSCNRSEMRADIACKNFYVSIKVMGRGHKAGHRIFRYNNASRRIAGFAAYTRIEITVIAQRKTLLTPPQIVGIPSSPLPDDPAGVTVVPYANERTYLYFALRTEDLVVLSTTRASATNAGLASFVKGRSTDATDEEPSRIMEHSRYLHLKTHAARSWHSLARKRKGRRGRDAMSGRNGPIISALQLGKAVKLRNSDRFWR